MKKPVERLFCQLGVKRKAMYRDELIHLIPRSYAHRVPRIDGACSMIYDIVDNQTNRVIGEIALRLGEGETRMGKASMAKLIYTLFTNKAVGE